jgi:hypothetical protein
MRLRNATVAWILLLVFSFISIVGEESESRARILKVLPHLLDAKGKHAISPSLLERDAYQAHLKNHPEEVSTLRFDVNWKLKEKFDDSLELRVEVRFGSGNSIQTLKAKTPLRPKKLRKRGWTSVQLKEKDYDPESNLIAWRVTVWKGDQQLASQKSFLW